MPSQVQIQTAMPSSKVSTINILTSRLQYQTCHIWVPDMLQRIAAICVRGHYYSYFKIASNQKQALQIADKLSRRNDPSIITQIPKGYAIWVLEPTAQQDKSAPIDRLASDAALNPENSNSLKILKHPPTCKIRVPDLEGTLSAVSIDGQYYSLFQAVQDWEELQRIIAILKRRGDKTAIAQIDQKYTIWVWEPEAKLDNSL